MRTVLFIAALLLFIIPASAQKKKDNTPLVNVFIGTEGKGHTYPGAVLPYGMVQLSPISRLSGTAYQFTDTLVYGFSHNRVNTADNNEESSLLFMPTTGEPKLNTADNSSPYKKKEEEASPGYYKTLLTKYNIGVELTTTQRAGMQRYDFPSTDKANIIIDLQHGGEVENSWIEVINKNELRGYRAAKSGQYYFYAKFSKPFKLYGIAANNVLQPGKSKAEGTNIKMFVQYDNPGNVMVKVGLSHVSVEGALKNLDAEIPAFDFKEVQKAAKTAWINELAKIQVEGGAPSKSALNMAANANPDPAVRHKKAPPAPDYALLKQTTFYTALYHTMLTPNIGSDVDGQYRGLDGKVTHAVGFTYYDLSSIQQSNLPLYQFLTLTDHKRTIDVIKSYLASPLSKRLKTIFDPLLQDAFTKGIKDKETEKADGDITAKAKYAPILLNEMYLDSLFNGISNSNPYNHLPYMYSFTPSQQKMQSALNGVIRQYTAAPNGIPAIDNQAQLSAWYVMSCLGIYNLAPTKAQYVIGLPQFDKALITLPNDKKFTIINTGASISRGNIYLQGLNLNKQGYNKLFINYEDLIKGGELEVFTGTMPNKLFMQDLEKPDLK
ncbi:MAG: glycoside hydrolase domain-containing protein [Mucilaginibacter sp.]